MSRTFAIALFVVSLAMPMRAQETPRDHAKNIFDGSGVAAQNAPGAPEVLYETEAKTELLRAVLNAHLESIPLTVTVKKQERSVGGWHWNGPDPEFTRYGGHWEWLSPEWITVEVRENQTFISFKMNREDAAILDMDNYDETAVEASWKSLQKELPALQGYASSGKIYLEKGSLTLEEFKKLKNLNVRGLIAAAYLTRTSTRLKDEKKKEIYKNLDSRAAWALGKDKVVLNKKRNEAGDKDLQTMPILTRSEYESFKKSLGQ